MIHLEATRNRDRTLIVQAGKLHPSVSFSRSSSGTGLGNAGLIVTAATNIPRYEYSAKPNYQGLLIEEARTNLLLNSEVLSGGTDNTATFTANTTTAPDGASTADTLVSSGAGTNSYAYNSVTLTADTYTLSTFVKQTASSGTQCGFATSGGDTFFMRYIWATDTINKGSNAIAAGRVLYPNGWVRIWVTGARSSGANIVVRILMSNPTASSAISLYTWGCQLELGTSLTSYIPTGASSVTRSADVLQATLSALGISTTAGTFVIEHDVASGQPLICSGSNVLLASAGGSKVAIAYDGSGWSKSVDGGTVTTSGTALTFSTTLDVGKSSTTSANGHIKRLVWYKTKRANSELQRLST